MTELDWDWTEIAVILMWRLCPSGVTITMADLVGLPAERVLVQDRTSEHIRFSWLHPQSAMILRDKKIAAGEKPTVEQLEGRYMKLATVLLWKLAKDGLTLTKADRGAVPSDVQLLMEGHHDGVLYRFVPRGEAARMAKRVLDDTGKVITERTFL